MRIYVILGIDRKINFNHLTKKINLIVNMATFVYETGPTQFTLNVIPVNPYMFTLTFETPERPGEDADIPEGVNVFYDLPNGKRISAILDESDELYFYVCNDKRWLLTLDDRVILVYDGKRFNIRDSGLREITN